MRNMKKALFLSTAAALTALSAPQGPVIPAGPLSLAGTGECTYPAKQIKGTPWSLQRVLLDQLWQDTKGIDKKTGRPVLVAVIDTGVDNKNPQLTDAVDAKLGFEVRKPGKNSLEKGKKGDGTDDLVGHGTKVAGIIAARPHDGTGFVGIAPDAKILPIRQNDEKGSGTTDTMADAIDKAVDRHARVINISQDTVKPLQANNNLERAINRALQNNVVVIASAGNDGIDGKVKKTYPAAYKGVLAVGSSDRNNERAPFSQAGDFVGVAAPGVDMVSTVPGGGQCVDNGTSFSAPYVAGVAALIRAKHPEWKQNQVVAQIEQTAERAVNGHDPYVGWGVVDPVRALTEDDHPIDHVTLDKGAAHNVDAPQPATLTLGETPQERRERLATYALGGGALLVAMITGAAAVLHEHKRRRSATARRA
ncbi:type VII secretion-associated serine protease mycosin [Streptomyces sp. NBS 14/10]|uniref:type VII secretion-associated serine protease mycosin n=1 Tax=Streptomyces sp. NBS 14/10 TaxID=1945643 RepID=UPI000B7FE0EE|nr:type VII secretion-associated serine protease mycosin [Streptomyces sp. NBS 14/10]KAK1182529.1 type VII secretion-associated serine protease mycosin [Streptomyces sp. NBS 14/10]